MYNQPVDSQAGYGQPAQSGGYYGPTSQQPPPYSSAPGAGYTYNYGAAQDMDMNDEDTSGGLMSSNFSEKSVRAGSVILHS